MPRSAKAPGHFTRILMRVKVGYISSHQVYRNGAFMNSLASAAACVGVAVRRSRTTRDAATVRVRPTGGERSRGRMMIANVSRARYARPYGQTLDTLAAAQGPRLRSPPVDLDQLLPTREKCPYPSPSVTFTALHWARHSERYMGRLGKCASPSTARHSRSQCRAIGAS